MDTIQRYVTYKIEIFQIVSIHIGHNIRKSYLKHSRTLLHCDHTKNVRNGQYTNKYEVSWLLLFQIKFFHLCKVASCRMTEC